MTFEEALMALADMDGIAHRLAWNEEVLTPQERVDLYVVARRVADRVTTTVRNSLRPDAINALADMDVPEGGSIPTAFALGVRRFTKRKPGKVEWSGWSLCDALAEDLVDIRSGEIERAVPVYVLRDVLPACSNDALTSSRWRLDGLKGRVPIDAFRRAEPDQFEADIEVADFDEETITALIHQEDGP